jgi:hypothetical protein
MLRVGCKHSHVNQQDLAKLTCLIVGNLDAIRLMSY